MYPECRHVKTNGCKCSSPALRRRHWCYFHDQLHRRQRPGRPPRPNSRLAATNAPHPELCSTQPVGPDPRTLDHGHIPVPDSAQAGCLELPVLEDQGAVQFALNDVLQALARNQLDPRRAGLLLYGLQIASHNSRELSAHHDPVRAITYAADGSALGPAEQGWDIEDMPRNSDDDEDEDDE